MSEQTKTPDTGYPSQHEANKMVRVLTDKRLKFTVRVHHPDGRILEWQDTKPPKLDWNAEARALFIAGGDYSAGPIMKWEDGMIILTEENPT